jgi:hypothetical protein
MESNPKKREMDHEDTDPQTDPNIRFQVVVRGWSNNVVEETTLKYQWSKAQQESHGGDTITLCEALVFPDSTQSTEYVRLKMVLDDQAPS